jgi:diadenosine tetraphosphate (Ap4A) HIT family hydrolase
MAQLEVLREWPLVVAIRDRFPVSPGHSLLITRRHVGTWFDASRDEHVAIVDAIEPVRSLITNEYGRTPDGWNVGFNAGVAAGQTVHHLHVHLIPRWRGDVSDPRGGVRGVIPSKQSYRASEADE